MARINGTAVAADHEATQARRRARRATLEDEAPLANNSPASTPERAARNAENAIRPARVRPREASAVQERPDQPARRTRGDRRVPEEVAAQFVQLKHEYYFKDGTRAFTDRGRRLTTPSENSEVVRALIEIAAARGWREIQVLGTERFRREAWGAAQAAGLEVRGYRPTEFERARLVRSIDRERGETRTPAHREPIDNRGREGAPQEREPQRSRAARDATDPRAARERERVPDRLIVGTLVDHGRAPYRRDPKEPMSYFVKLETDKGDRDIWGVDLERALKHSLTRPAPGDVVGLRAVRQELVTVKAPARDANGAVVGEKDLATHRNRWSVERREFFEERAAAAQTLRDGRVEPKVGAERHPELVGTYLKVHAAELAAKQLRDPQDRVKFVALVRSALADAIERGEPLDPVRLREATPARGGTDRSSTARRPAPNEARPRAVESAPERVL